MKPIRFRSISLLALCSLGLSGCDYTLFETVITRIQWTPETERIELSITAMNVSAEFLECTGTGTECATKLASWTKEGDLLNLTDAGCGNLQQTIFQRGNMLDYQSTCSSQQNTAFLIDGLGIHVEKEGRVGKEKAHLLLINSPESTGQWTELPKSAKQRIRKVYVNEKLEEHVAWSLKPKFRTAKAINTFDEDVVPLFEKFPELATLLHEQKLLVPTP
jgi:hypothetical protein